MQTSIQLPKAFSVRDEHEFITFKHLMARLNPELRVSQVGMGLHTNGGYTVFWGLVHLAGQKLEKAESDTALREAGYDFQHNVVQIDYSLLLRDK